MVGGGKEKGACQRIAPQEKEVGKKKGTLFPPSLSPAPSILTAVAGGNPFHAFFVI